VSGLIEVKEILRDIEGIAFVYFDEKDVVRHRLVQDIVRAYDRHQSATGGDPRLSKGPVAPQSSPSGSNKWSSSVAPAPQARANSIKWPSICVRLFG
jgi:phosphate starvation-inducible PhoH-like protein